MQFICLKKYFVYGADAWVVLRIRVANSISRFYNLIACYTDLLMIDVSDKVSLKQTLPRKMVCVFNLIYLPKEENDFVSRHIKLAKK